MSSLVRAGLLVGSLALILLFSATIAFATMSSAPAIIVMTALFGVALGCTLGVLLLPEGDANASASRMMVALITALVAGSVLARLNDIVNQLKVDGVPVTLAGLIFTTDVLVGLLSVAAWRAIGAAVAAAPSGRRAARDAAPSATIAQVERVA